MPDAAVRCHHVPSQDIPRCCLTPCLVLTAHVVLGTETVACAAFALRCKLDRPDLSEVLSSNLMDAIDQLLSGESKAWQGWGEALPSLTRLLRFVFPAVSALSAEAMHRCCCLP